MMSSEVHRSLVAGAVLMVAEVGLGAATGNDMNLTGSAMDGATMAVSSYACDLTHNLIQMTPTTVSSAVCTGAVYTIAKSFLFNDNRFLTNYLLAAAADVATDPVSNMLPPFSHMQE